MEIGKKGERATRSLEFVLVAYGTPWSQNASQEVGLAGVFRFDPSAARELRRDLKDALTAFASGRGSVESLLHQIERIARYVTGKPDVALGRARKRMKRLVRCFAPALIDNTGLPGVRWDDLYSAVVEGRNDLAHTGTEAALVGVRVATLATVLLAALAEVAKGKSVVEVKDIMVSNPVFAHGWQTLADLRRTMLVNDFSVLPLNYGEAKGCQWRCVRAEELASFLAKNRKALGCTLTDVLDGKCGDRMCVPPACIVHENTERGKLLGQNARRLPVVVGRKVRERYEIVGIVTAFDLL